MRVADPAMIFTWIALAIYCAAYFPLAIFLARFLVRRTPLPLVVTLPVLWTALEFFRSHFASGFSWYLIGYTQHDFLPVIQVSDITGAYGVSFLVVAVNAVLFEVVWRSGVFPKMLAQGQAAPGAGWLAVAAQCLVVMAALGATLGYGQARLNESAFTPGPRVALVQGNVPQQIRNQAGMAGRLFHAYDDLSKVAITYRPDLMVWPETSFPGGYLAVDAGVDHDRLSPKWQEGLQETKKLVHKAHSSWPTNVLLGLNSYIGGADGEVRTYNSALLIDNDGAVAGRYDKIHRVPFGEYVPLKDTLPFMKCFVPYDFDYGVEAGQSYTQLPLRVPGTDRRFTFGVAICYEDTVPDVTRPYGGGGSHATDFLLNISNDGWFDGTSEHQEHLAISRFRAIECRRAVARAVNMGISAVIDANGRVLRPQPIPHPEHLAFFTGSMPNGSLAAFPWTALYLNRSGLHIWGIPASPAEQSALPPGDWHEYKKISGILLATIPIDTRSSFYARHGDWLPWSCWSLLAAALLFSLFRRRELSLN